MTDDLKHLKDAMSDATPKASSKDAHLALAMKNFDDLQNSRQGSVDEARHIPDRPTITSRLTSGALHMFQSLTVRGALAATTSISAVGFGVFLYTQQTDISFDLPSPDPVLVAIPAEQPAPKPYAGKHAENAPATTALSDDARRISVQQQGLAAAPVDETEADTSMSEMVQSAPESPVVSRKTAPAPMGKIANGIVAYDMITPEIRQDPNTETFANTDANPVKITGDDPVSTFSIDVDTASYSVMRNSLMNGHLPNPQSVRIEEMINYFPYDYPAPNAGEAPFKPTVTVFQTPWNAATQLVHIGIQGQIPALENRPALNLVFLIDTSGSMVTPNKLPLLIQSFRLMLSELNENDEVSIVTYAGSAGQVLKPTKASDKSTIMAALTRLSAGGSTAGQQGLQQAYTVAEEMRGDGEISRIILATDGDFNVGIRDPEQLKDYIAKKRDSGTYLSVLGFGRGNLNDATMQALAQNGNGTAAYIDTLSEAQKVLVDQLGSALFPIANDVKIQVEFNPAMIAEYRLIGYETRSLNREDFNNDKVDAGEIGAGHNVTAIYEITPVGSDAILNDALRYQPATKTDDTGELGFLKLRYKNPGEDVSQLLSTPITSGMGTPSDDIRFSAAIAGYGQLLSNAKYLQDWGYEALINLANQNKGEDAYGYRSEAIKLMRLAKSLSTE